LETAALAAAPGISAGAAGAAVAGGCGTSGGSALPVGAGALLAGWPVEPWAAELVP